jgi:hypothetical protein
MIRQRELAEKKEEEEREYWFNRLRPMTKPKQTCREKRLAKEEGDSTSDNSGEEVRKITLARGEDISELGNYNPESGNCHLESGNHIQDSGIINPGKENDQQGEDLVLMDVNKVSTILAEFFVTTKDVTELALGAEHVLFKKPENLGAHMKPLFI